MFKTEYLRYAVVKTLLVEIGAEELFDTNTGVMQKPIREYSSSETFILDLAIGLIDWDHPVILWKGLSKLDLKRRSLVLGLFEAIATDDVENWID